MSPDDELKALGELSPRDVDPWRREQIRRKAQAELRRQTALARRPWIASVGRFYTRILEPTLIAGATCAYLAWAFQTITEIMSQRPVP